LSRAVSRRGYNLKNGPKVRKASLSKIRLFAGKSGASNATCQGQNSASDNASGADNQQENTVPQRLYAGRFRKGVKIQSEPHGDMGRLAEMTSPPGPRSGHQSNRTERNSLSGK